MERALSSAGDPHRAYASLHVGGTNGKGSVTVTLASIMSASGRRTGCFVSPHLVSFRERIRVDGEPLAEEALRRYADEIREIVSECGLTFFEAATLLALHAFAREAVDVAALEVGLGGRLDSTNAVLPVVTAVTNVALDHTDYLGETLPEIAAEKAGIIKPGVPFLTTEKDPAVLEMFATHAHRAAAPMRVVSGTEVRSVAATREGTSFRMTTATWGEVDLHTPLAGHHQALNVALAVAACEELPDALRPTRRQLVRGVASARHRGRNELVVIDGRTWLLDVAHNPAGMASLLDTLDGLETPEPRVALVCVLADKDWGAMAPPLAERCHAVVLTVADSVPPERRWDPAEVARVLEERSSGADVWIEEDFKEALDRAAALAGQGTVIVTGSVHTVGGAMRGLGIAP